MACYHPITAYRSRAGRSKVTGNWPIVFDVKEGYIDLPVIVSCGRCIGCRLEYSRQWAIRCVHESSLYDNNCFITLTYNNDFLDSNLSLNKRDMTLFLKRLRKRFGDGIRYYQTGEYGSISERPHHHALLFNFDFPDKVAFSYRSGVALYTSEILQDLWPYGFCTIGNVTFESAGYVARYMLKKWKGTKEEVQAYYGNRIPEYSTMSRRPGIASDWFDKYHSDVYRKDYVVIRDNFICRPPKFYDRKFDILEPERYNSIKIARKRIALDSKEKDSFERLAIKEKLTFHRLRELIRVLD